MSISLRMAAPVAALGVVSLTAQMWAAGGPGDGVMRAMIVTALGAAVLCLVAVMMGRRVVDRLRHLPDHVRNIAWGNTSDAIPGVGAQDEIGALTRAFATLGQDMCGVIESRAEMEKLALSDPLTGLPNRRGLFEFMARIERDMTGAIDDRIGVMHVDLDHFKTINDTMGHDAGDHVLKEATRRISSAIRDSDVLARLGGDEFVVIAPGVESERTLERIAERIISQFEVPVFYKDAPCTVGASIGIVLGGQRGRVLDPTRLLINADIALCHAKEGGRNRHAVFNSTMARAIQRRRTEAEEIRHGLLNDAFQPWFLPTVDTDTGRPVSIDVLARWDNPNRGLLSPNAFLDTVEAHNMVEELGMQVFERACATVADWRAQGIDVPRLHLGMSRAQLLAPAIVDKISWLLDDAGLPTNHVEIGISERHCNGRSVELVFANLKRFSALGLHIVLDDFGSDNGSLSNILRLGAGQVRAAGGGAVQNELLYSLMGIGDRLNIPIVMKDVGDGDQMQRLQTLGVRLIQGAVLTPEMNGAEMTSWLVSQNLGQDVASAG